MTLGRDRVTQALPNYTVGEEVGRGAWGIVLSGEHRRLGRKVAIKQLPQAFAADPGVQRRFASEARLLASLDHPHIVPIFDYVEEDDLCLLVMELLPGGTVWDRITTVGISPETACTVVMATCSALHYAHGRGILHRDIKPENLLFSSSGALKVTDFGIAKVLGGVETFATRTGEVMGTPAYIAPEQAVAGELTPATDVYAVGTLLYELLAGRLPFVDDGNAIALLYRHVHEAPTPLLDVAPSVPRPIAEATMRALASDPDDRYPTAEEFGATVAEAASMGWGSGWIRRAGLSVMASGEIAARMSGGARVQAGPTAEDGVKASSEQPTASAASKTEPHVPAAEAVAGPPSAPGAPPGPPRVGTARGGSRRPSAVEVASPTDLVAVQDILPERLTDPGAPAAAEERAPGASGTVAEAPRTGPPIQETTLSPLGSPAAAATTVDKPPKRPRRRLVVIGAAALFVIAGVAVIVVLLASGGGGPSTTVTSSGQPSVASPPGREVFSDNFSNPQSGWVPDSNQDDNGTASYVDGGYQVTALKPNAPLNTFSVSSPFTTPLTSMASKVDATIQSGTSADGAGVRCDQGSRNGLRYTFQANGDGSWVIFKLGVSGQPAIAQGRSSAIHGRGGQNTITGQCTELGNGATRLVMTVNSVVVGGATDAHGGNPIGWHTALTVYRSASSQQTQVRFTNFATYDAGAS